MEFVQIYAYVDGLIRRKMEELYEYDPATRQYRRVSATKRSERQRSRREDRTAPAEGYRQESMRARQASGQGVARAALPLEGFTLGKFLFWFGFFTVLIIWAVLIYIYVTKQG